MCENERVLRDAGQPTCSARLPDKGLIIMGRS